MNADHSDGVGPTVACACGQAARYAGRRPKTFLSVVGPLTLERAYYHCDACHAGSCSRDRALGLEGTSLSPATMRMVGLAAAEVSFAKTSELLGKLSCIPSFCKHQITPKTSRYTRCSMSMFPNAFINGRIRSSGQLGRWWYSISPWRNNECVRRFTVFAFNQRS